VIVPHQVTYSNGGANALSIEDNVLRTQAIPSEQRLPGVHTIVQIVIREDVAVDARAHADVEATHLAQVQGVAE